MWRWAWRSYRQDGIGLLLLLSPGTVDELCSTQQNPDGPLITQYEKSTIEELGAS